MYGVFVCKWISPRALSWQLEDILDSRLIDSASSAVGNVAHDALAEVVGLEMCA